VLQFVLCEERRYRWVLTRVRSLPKQNVSGIGSNVAPGLKIWQGGVLPVSTCITARRCTKPDLHHEPMSSVVVSAFYTFVSL